MSTYLMHWKWEFTIERTSSLNFESLLRSGSILETQVKKKANFRKHYLNDKQEEQRKFILTQLKINFRNRRTLEDISTTCRTEYQMTTTLEIIIYHIL